MSLQACANIVQRGDPDRFAATMAAPIAARRIMFPLYAFNVEVARAPWVTEEPMIAEMRLQWWRDALEEISQDKIVRKHEVTTPLAEVLSPQTAQDLDYLIQARRWDIYKEAFEDEDHFDEYLERTGGLLMTTTARSLGAEIKEAEQAAIMTLGKASAFVRFLMAVPALEARGRIPLVDGRAEAIAQRANDLSAALQRDNALLKGLKKSVKPALFEAWQAAPLLKQVAINPNRVSEGAIGLSELRKRARLFRWAL